MLFNGSNFLADHDVVRFGTLRLWAERGLIHIEDSKDNSYEAMSVKVCLQRMKSISEMLGNSSQRDVASEDQFDRNNRKRHQNMLDGMIEVVRRAQVQGMPDDASARRDLVRRRPKSVVVPGYGGGM